jgi:hypothetical protein
MTSSLKPVQRMAGVPLAAAALLIASGASAETITQTCPDLRLGSYVREQPVMGESTVEVEPLAERKLVTE